FVVPVAVIDGGVRSLAQVTVLEVVAELPHPSTAVNVLTCVTVHVAVVAGASLEVMVTVPHASVAVAEPSAALISAAVGLHAKVFVVPVAVIDGGVRSLVQVTVLEVVAELPHPSTAVNVLTCVTVHVAVVAGASLEVMVTVPHASVAVAEPSAALISAAVGLHAKVFVVPVAVIDGGVRSLVQVTVLEVVAELPHPSTAVNVLTCVTVHVAVVAGASLEVMVTVPHASVAVAEPSAALISAAVGLHAKVFVVPVAVIDGGVRSLVQVTVLEVVAELPHPSTAVNVLTCVTVHVAVVAGASLEVMVTVPHASVAVAEPSAALISAAVGLHAKVFVVPVAVIDGGVRSLVQVTVLEVVAELPHPSTAVNVLTCVTVHVAVVAGASLEVMVTVPHASVAVAEPSAALISAAVGLHAKGFVVPVAVIDGGVRSLVQVTVLEGVAEVPHPSTAVNVLTCVTVHVAVVAGASLEVMVTVPHASVAVAEPSAALISAAVGLHAKVFVVPVAVIDGGVRSLVQVTVLEVVAELPHPSTAVNVLTCVTVHVAVV